MTNRRTLINVGVFMALAALLVWAGLTTLVLQKGGGQTVHFLFTDAAGLSARNDVTMRGVPVGQVSDVVLQPNGLANVKVSLEPGIHATKGSTAEIERRSPIGDLVLDITPGRGTTLADDATVGTRYTIPPPDPEKTIQELALILHAIPSQDLSSLVHTLAVAVNGRAQDLQTLEVAGADLPQKLLQVRTQLEHLIDISPTVLDVLANNSKALADDITQTADLAEILDHEKHNLVDLSKNGAAFATVANEIISSQKPNLACLVHDFAVINSTLAQPQHLHDLDSVLELNHFFFDAVWNLVLTGLDGMEWFRVQLLPAQQPPGQAYVPKRAPADVYLGNSCQSIYGRGVGPVTQPGPAYIAPGSHVHPGS
jgi:phospholipid/cholesterol/gamma-HCH transport system substrate-binding protein